LSRGRHGEVGTVEFGLHAAATQRALVYRFPRLPRTAGKQNWREGGVGSRDPRSIDPSRRRQERTNDDVDKEDSTDAQMSPPSDATRKHPARPPLICIQLSARGRVVGVAFRRRLSGRVICDTRVCHHQLQLIMVSSLIRTSSPWLLSTRFRRPVMFLFSLKLPVIITTSAPRVVLFSVMPVCVFVCVSATVRDIITKFPGHHPIVEGADKGRRSSIMAIYRGA